MIPSNSVHLGLTPFRVDNMYGAQSSGTRCKRAPAGGNGFLYVKPVGTLVLGTYGRVDLNGTKGDRLLILETWENWKFAKRTPKLETWDWNKENFLETIQELM